MIALALLLAGADALPADVRRLSARYADCTHWLGEEPYDAERAREIAAAVRTACRGNERERQRLLRRYRATPAVRTELEKLVDPEG